MPAATVSFVASSTRMKAPVARFTSYGSTISGAERRSRTRPMSFSFISVASPSSSVSMSTTPSMPSTTARTVRVVCLTPNRAPGWRGRSLIQQTRRLERPRGHRLVVRVDEHVAARHVDLILEADRHGHAGRRLLDRAAGHVDRRDAGAEAGGQHEHVVAGPPDAAGDLARVAAVVVVLVGHRPDHPLDGEAAVGEVAVARELDLLEVVEQRRALPPRHPLGRVDEVVAVERGDRDRHLVLDAERGGEVVELLLDLVEPRLVEVDEIHLVDGEDEVGDGEERRDQRVAARLLDHALARVDEHDGDVGRRGAGDHVARVLDVARGVGELEAAPRGDEAAVGDVDRDPLLALGAQPVGEQREVDVAVAAALARLLDGLHLVDEHLLRVEEQAPDQGRLAVVDGAARDEPQQLRRAVGRHGRDAPDQK